MTFQFVCVITPHLPNPTKYVGQIFSLLSVCTVKKQYLWLMRGTVRLMNTVQLCVYFVYYSPNSVERSYWKQYIFLLHFTWGMSQGYWREWKYICVVASDCFLVNFMIEWMNFTVLLPAQIIYKELSLFSFFHLLLYPVRLSALELLSTMCLHLHTIKHLCQNFCISVQYMCWDFNCDHKYCQTLPHFIFKDSRLL